MEQVKPKHQIDRRSKEAKYAQRNVQRTVGIQIFGYISPYAAPGILREQLKRYDRQVIMNIVCQVAELTPEEIVKVSRKTEIVTARQILIYLLRFHCSQAYTLGRIAEFCSPADDLEKKHHTTIIHASNLVIDMVNQLPQFKDYIKDFKDGKGTHKIAKLITFECYWEKITEALIKTHSNDNSYQRSQETR